MYSTAGTPSNCSAAEKPPTDKNQNFDVNANLIQFQNANVAIQKLTPGLQELTRATIMTSLFYSNRKYDLKNSPNPDMRSGQAFGNWFYGAAAAEIGYTKDQALKAGAIVQQVQNYADPKNPAYQDITVMVERIANATRTGLGDNAGDPELIAGGFDYATNIFNNDAGSKSTSNSCEKAPPNFLGAGDVGGATTIGAGATWRSGSVSPAPGCYGKCGPSGGSVNVTPLKLLLSY
jgi:hypothetical protein